MKVQFFTRCEICKHNPQIQPNLTVGFYTCNGLDWVGNFLIPTSLSWIEKMLHLDPTQPMYTPANE